MVWAIVGFIGGLLVISMYGAAALKMEIRGSKEGLAISKPAFAFRPKLRRIKV